MGGDNINRRPAFYSKDRCLSSLVEAKRMSGVPGELIFLNDGPLPSYRSTFMASAGQVVALPSVGNSRSHRTALALVDSRGWDDGDWVVLAEDDHLWLPEAFKSLAELRLAGVELVTFYNHPDYLRLPEHLRFAKRHQQQFECSGGYVWRPVRSTVMSFGARVGTLREWNWIHWLATRGPVPGDFDAWSTLCRVGSTRLIRLLVDTPSMRDGEILRRAAGRFAGRKRSTPLIFAPTTSLSTHMQLGEMADGRDWESVAISLPAIPGST